MGNRRLNFCVIVLLCVLFDYAEVAWVFDPCTNHHEHLNLALGETHHDADTEPSDEGAPRLHCVPDSSIFGPTTLEASTQITITTEELPLNISSAAFRLAGAPHMKNTLWLGAVFKKTVTFP